METKEKTPLTALDVRMIDFDGCHAFFFKSRLDIDNLKKNLTDLVREIPDIAGRLIEEDGCFYILKNGAGVGFHVDTLDRSILSVERSSVHKYGASLAKKIVNEDEPIFNIKITRFREGDLLCINRSHAICDGNGLFGLLARWARLCRGDSPLPPMNLDRKTILSMQQQPISAAAVSMPKTTSDTGGKRRCYSYKKINVSLSEFGRLKERIIRNEGGETWVSTRDVVIAKFLKELSFVKKTGEEICVTSVVNFRKNHELGIGVDYFGNAVHSIKGTYKVEDLRHNALLDLARKYRSSTSHGLSISKIIEAINCRQEESMLSETMVFVDDVSKFPLYEIDFGSGLPFRYEIAPVEEVDPAQWFGPSIVNSIFMLPENAGNEGFMPAWIGLAEDEMGRFLRRVLNEGFFVL